MEKTYKGTRVESIDGNKITMEDNWIHNANNYITINSPFTKGDNCRKITSIHYKEKPLTYTYEHGLNFPTPHFGWKKTILTLDYSDDVKVGDVFYAHGILERFFPKENTQIYAEAIERFGLTKKGLDICFDYAMRRVKEVVEFKYQQHTNPIFKEGEMYIQRYINEPKNEYL